MPSTHPFYGFAGLDYAQAVSAIIHQWSTGIIKSDLYTKVVARVEEKTRDGQKWLLQRLEEMSLQPHQ